MRILGIILLLTVAACSKASGPVYNESDIKDGNLVVYRTKRATIKDLTVNIDDKPYCQLDANGFFVTTIDKPVKLSTRSSTDINNSEFVAHKGFVRIDKRPLTTAERISGVFGGVIGASIAESAQDSGMYTFQQVEPEEAKFWMKQYKMRRQCVNGSNQPLTK